MYIVLLGQLGVHSVQFVLELRFVIAVSLLSCRTNKPIDYNSAASKFGGPMWAHRLDGPIPIGRLCTG